MVLRKSGGGREWEVDEKLGLTVKMVNIITLRDCSAVTSPISRAICAICSLDS